VHSGGAVGAVVSGLPVRTVVSQGCRPIGHEAVITRCEANVVSELAGKQALERLRGEIAALSFEEQALAARGLLVGLVIDENRPEYETGDFLIRGLLGADKASGALVLGDTVRVGQTLRCSGRLPAVVVGVERSWHGRENAQADLAHVFPHAQHAFRELAVRPDGSKRIPAASTVHLPEKLDRFREPDVAACGLLRAALLDHLNEHRETESVVRDDLQVVRAEVELRLLLSHSVQINSIVGVVQQLEHGATPCSCSSASSTACRHFRPSHSSTALRFARRS
jgi:hypothetical protein